MKNKLKVIAFNGSARKNGNTVILINAVFRELTKAGIDTELIQLAGKNIAGCNVCGKCKKNKNLRCSQDKDDLNLYINKMVEADGIILASPVYFANLTPQIKCLIDRAGMVTRANDNALARKAGASIAVARRGGADHVFNSLNHFFFISEMIVPGSNYWNYGFGKKSGDVLDDKEGIEIMRVLGKNMAWLLKKLNK